MNLAFYVRTQGEPDTIGPTLRAQTRAIDPSVNLFDVAPLREFIGASLYPQKVAASLMTIMGTIALVLAAVGALQRHGLLGGATHARDWRTHGTRIAGVSFTNSAMGTSALLLEKGGRTPVVYLAGAAFLCLVAIAASFLPAYRAASIDPMKALRTD